MAINASIKKERVKYNEIRFRDFNQNTREITTGEFLWGSETPAELFISECVFAYLTGKKCIGEGFGFFIVYIKRHH